MEIQIRPCSGAKPSYLLFCLKHFPQHVLPNSLYFFFLWLIDDKEDKNDPGDMTMMMMVIRMMMMMVMMMMMMMMVIRLVRASEDSNLCSCGSKLKRGEGPFE